LASKKNKSVELNKSLGGLQDKACEQTKLYQSSREVLYETIVDTYLWWRDARDELGYLEQLYDENEITFRQSGNKPTFTGVIRLVWGMNEPKYQGTVSQWNGALGIIDDEYVENTARYRNNPKQLLLGYLYDNGGLSQLRKNKGWLAEEDEEPAAPKKPKKQKGGMNAETRTAQKQDGIKFFKSSGKPFAVVDTGNPVLTTQDGLVAVLARRNSKGELELLATSDNESYIADIAADTAIEDLSNAPPNLCLLTEAISTHSLPSKMRSMKNKLLERSKFTMFKEDEKAEPIKLYRRLTIRPKRGDMLVSLSRADVSVVTRITPNEPLKKTGNDIMLKGDLVSYVEDTYLYDKSLRYTVAKPHSKIKSAGSQYKASHLIEMKNTKSKSERNLYLYNPAFLFEEHRFQADYNDGEKFVPLWTLNVTPNWIHSLHVNMTGNWINHWSPNITRNEHRVFELSFTDKAWQTAFSYRNGGFEHSPKEPFSAECKVRLVGKKQSFKVLSKDFITVFNALHEQKITSRKIRIEGNLHVMRITYKTKLGEYKIFIPASETTINRDEMFFKKYEYV
jgi:hypothetical protein